MIAEPKEPWRLSRPRARRGRGLGLEKGGAGFRLQGFLGTYRVWGGCRLHSMQEVAP